MTELEKLLYNSVNKWLTDTLVGVDGLNKECIFYLNPNGGTIATGASMFMQIDGQYIKLDDEIPDKPWFQFLGVIRKPLVDIYNHQQKFWYVIISDVDGNVTFTYENERNQYRFELWEYDVFGIGDRRNPRDKRILDEYRPLN